VSQCLGRILRLGDHFQVWLVFEQPPQSLPDQSQLVR
jgi:hypothetical protein